MDKNHLLDTFNTFTNKDGKVFSDIYKKESDIIKDAVDIYYKNLQPDKTNNILFQIGDAVISHNSDTNCYTSARIKGILINNDGVSYCTDSPQIFTNNDVGRSFFKTMELALQANDNSCEQLEDDYELE